MRWTKFCYITACALAGLMPLLAMQIKQPVSGAGTNVFPGWPAQFDGKSLSVLSLNEMEQKFATDFPGRIGRFTDGSREIIVRWVTEGTRKMHPASDCFQGLGYTVKPLPLRRDQNGVLWSSFSASKRSQELLVYERIYSDSGQTWTDVSSWYWSAIRQESGSWWAITVAEEKTASSKPIKLVE